MHEDSLVHRCWAHTSFAGAFAAISGRLGCALRLVLLPWDCVDAVGLSLRSPGAINRFRKSNIAPGLSARA